MLGFGRRVRADMNAIGWNPFNDDESTVLNLRRVSFYKGMPVVRISGRSGSFAIMFLDPVGSTNDTVRHEWGHAVQLWLTGPVRYGLGVGIPSAFGWGRKSYYRNPQEITADIFGGVTPRSIDPRTSADESIGWWYMSTVSLLGPIAWLYYLGV